VRRSAATSAGLTECNGRAALNSRHGNRTAEADPTDENSVRTRAMLAMLVTVAASCTTETRRPATTAWVVTPDGIGAIRVGMTADELRRAVGDVPGANPTADCSYVRPSSAPAGVSVMLAHGQVARVDIDSAGVRSDAGVAVGDSAAKVADVYATRMTATPHKYIPGAQYLTVRSASPADSTRRMVFETENGRVTRFRTGRVPEVEWVERCG
jgi:hypothetical protein